MPDVEARLRDEFRLLRERLELRGPDPKRAFASHRPRLWFHRRLIVAVTGAGIVVGGSTGLALALTASHQSATPTTTVTSSPVAPKTPSIATTPTPLPVPVPGLFSPSDFTAISATQWWLIGPSPCRAGTCSLIAATADGGITWHALSVPGPPYAANGEPVSGDVTELRFSTPQIGWAFGPALYGTVDGGRTWTPIDLGGSVDSLEPGLGKVYAVVSPGPYPATCNASGGCSDEQLWSAPIGTSDWTLDTAPGDFVGPVAVHGEDVYLLPAKGTSSIPGILASTDEGTHFTTYPNVGYGLGCTFSPVTDDVVWGFCSTGMFGGGVISTDGGHSFTGVDLGQAPNDSALVGASATVAVAVSGAQGQPLEQTTDGGKTFIDVQAAPSPTGNWKLIGFTNPEDGYALWNGASGTGTEDLWHTTDGGANWSQVVINSTPPPPTATCQVSQLTAEETAEGGSGGFLGATVILTNGSAFACSLYGYPGVEAVGSSGQTITNATRGCLYLACKTITPRLVTLQPGGSAYFSLEWEGTSENGQSCPGASFARVTPPNDYQYMAVSFPILPVPVDVCGTPPQLEVSPVAPGSG